MKTVSKLSINGITYECLTHHFHVIIWGKYRFSVVDTGGLALHPG